MTGGELENNVEGPAVAADTIKVLVATDVHLGFMENDPERGGDSFVAFEEVLATAGECGADLVLLAGDLFHVARPSPASLLRATRALREHCLGDKPVQLELLSDAKEAFQRSVNYEDPDLNVSVPVVTIHGNHDDPVGQGAVSSLDILSSMGLVNYLGRWSDYTHVSLAPVLFRKGETRLALYGLGHLKDQRLSRLFKEGKVEMQRPPGDDWFNLFALHQNRVDRGPGNYIQEEVLPDFLDLVIWGHEHDCRVHEEQNRSKKFYVSQPGSTVATSLAAGEALPKHMALLQIHKKKFMLTPIPLKTVRPFIFKTIVLSEENLGEETVNENEKVQEFLETKVNEAVEEAAHLRSGHPQQPTLPLVRLNVLFERDSQDFNRVRFGQKFSGVVANPHDLLVMKRERRVRERRPAPDAGDEEAQAAALAAAGTDAADVEMLLHSYYAALPEERRGEALSARALTDAVRAFTSKRDTDAFQAVLRATRTRALDALRAAGAETEAEVSAVLRSCRLELDDADEERLAGLVRKAAAAPQPQLKTPIVLAKRIVIVSSDDDMPVSAVATRGKAARGGGGRGARGRGGRVRAPPAAAAAAPASPPSPSPTRRNTPRRSAAKRSASWLQNVITVKADIDDDSD